jgi:magnesium transporter
MNTSYVPPAPPGRIDDVLAAWGALDPEERLELFRTLGPAEDDEVFLSLSSEHQAELLLALPASERRVWIRALAPDDAADVLQLVPDEAREGLLGQLDRASSLEVRALLAFEEDVAGGLMSPRFARIRPDMTVAEALAYLRKQASEVETIYTVYVLDQRQRLLGVLSLRELFAAEASRSVADLMRRDVVTVSPTADQEEVARVIAAHDLLAVPVVDEEGVMRGLVTVDDVVDVVAEEATEDMHKLGGLEALDASYLDVSLPHMIRKRAGWLAVLFVGEMLTATAMAWFEDEIARAVVLALFVPLIISSGGNSGSQATTLVIRAMALGEVRPRDVLHVLGREAATGVALGVILAVIGFLRVVAWQGLFGTYGEHAATIAVVVGLSLVGVVLAGSVVGGLLPLALRRLGLDPASASAPFVATVVDVAGLVIYFSVAKLLLGGTLL